jgi:hypothetical protein
MEMIQDNEFLLTISPFVYALGQGKFELAEVLYESGSCSNQELFETYDEVEKACHGTDEHSLLYQFIHRDLLDANSKAKKMSFLKEKATTPRRLESLCRLTISHSLNVRGRRERAVLQLQLLESAKNYVLFKDCTSTLHSLEKDEDFTREAEKWYADRPDYANLVMKRVGESILRPKNHLFQQETAERSRDLLGNSPLIDIHFLILQEEGFSRLFPNLDCKIDTT